MKRRWRRDTETQRLLATATTDLFMTPIQDSDGGKSLLLLIVVWANWLGSGPTY